MDQTEKEQRQHQIILIKFEPFLPCTTQDCLNEATVGTAQYDFRTGRWDLTPICKSCTIEQAKQYGVDVDE